MPARLPDHEYERLAELHALDILDTEPEEAFDRLTRLAAHILDVPIVLISLVDEHRQWFKSKIGLSASETSRDVAFCGYTILGDDVMVVPDALHDPRFADNPLVVGQPEIRFYAGAPLILGDGLRLGTLCAIDTKPRTLSQEEVIALRDLATIVIEQLNLRQHARDLAEANRALHEQTTQLERANEALRQFAHMTSHDLRAPLKKIINLADLVTLDANGPLPEEIDLIRESAVALETLVLGYRRLAGLDKGVASAHLLSTMIDDASRGRREVQPLVRGDAEVMCDPSLIGQALVNLLDNAAKYGDEPLVRFTAAEDRHGVTLTTSNTVAHHLDVDDSVFVPFRRLTSGGEGSGLGLAIVQRVMQLHGGSASAECSNTTFSVTLTFPKLASA